MQEYANTVLPLAFQMLLSLEHEPEAWQLTDEDDVADQILYGCGVNAIERLSQSLNAKICLKFLQPIWERILSTTQPTTFDRFDAQRYAALVAIQMMCDSMVPVVDENPDLLKYLLDIAVRCLQMDKHPRLLHQSINIIGQMCASFSPNVQQQFHRPIVDILLTVADSHVHPKVTTQALLSMIDLLENEFPEELIVQPQPDGSKCYADRALGSCVSSLKRSAEPRVQEAALSLISSIAKQAKDRFEQYFDFFWGVCTQALVSPVPSLQGKAQEAISYLATALGPDRFIKAQGIQVLRTMVQQYSLFF